MPSDPLILAFDTSAAHCAAALLCGGKVFLRTEEMGKGQAERLFPMLEEMLVEAGTSWAELDAIGVGIGPGNFTGIRIGVAAARGLALSLKIPAVGVSTFDALALDAGFVVTSVAAPRNTMYVKLPDADPVQCDIADMPLPNPKAEALAIGHRAEDIAARTGGRAVAPKYPLAEAIARKARRKMHNVALPPPAPLYIKPADAAPASDPPPVILDDA